MGKVGHVWRHPICTSITTTQPQKDWIYIHFLAHERVLNLLHGHIIWNCRDIRYIWPLIITYFCTFERTAHIRWQVSEPIRVRVGLGDLLSFDVSKEFICFFIDSSNEKCLYMGVFYISGKLLKNAKRWCMLRPDSNKITVGDRWFTESKTMICQLMNVDIYTETNRKTYT